jgi:hypothetical protein
VGTASRWEWLGVARREGTKVTRGASVADGGGAGSDAARSAKSSICLVTEGVTDSGMSIAVCRFVLHTLTWPVSSFSCWPSASVMEPSALPG